MTGGKHKKKEREKKKKRNAIYKYQKPNTTMQLSHAIALMHYHKVLVTLFYLTGTLAAFALKASNVLPYAGGLIANTIPAWQWGLPFPG